MVKEKKYRSKISGIYAIVAIVIATIIIGSFICIFEKEDMIAICIGYGIAVVVYYFAIVLPLVNTVYIVRSDCLEIRCGIYKKEILYKQINDVYKKKSRERQPALSDKRVYIYYNDRGVKNTIGLSPKNLNDFVGEIKEKISIYRVSAK